MAETENKRKNRSGIFIIIIALLVGLNGLMWYMNMNATSQMELTSDTLRVKEHALVKARHDLDSLGKALEERIAEVQKLGGDTTTLGQMRRGLLADLKRARKTQINVSPKELNELKEQVKNYEADLEKRDKEIEDLKKERDAFFADNAKLKSDVQRTADSLSKLSQSTKELSDKITAASTLRADNIKVTVIDSKGKEHDNAPYKAKYVDKLKVTFVIADNKVAKIENKDVYLVIVGHDGSVLSDLSLGGGNFTKDGKESPYTSKQSFLFDNKQPTVVFVWGKGSKYEKGDYHAELYCEGARIGVNGFTIK